MTKIVEESVQAANITNLAERLMDGIISYLETSTDPQSDKEQVVRLALCMVVQESIRLLTTSQQDRIRMFKDMGFLIARYLHEPQEGPQ